MSSLKLSGKTALVTGASEGIGRGIALDLAAQGAFVIVNSRSPSRLQLVVDEIKQKGGDAVAIVADVSKVSEIKILFEKIAAIKPSIDIVIANAAFAEFKPLAEVTEDEWDRQFALNAKGSFFVLQAAAKAVVEGGKIIAISSSGTKMQIPGGAVYFATKGALEQIVKTLAVEVAPKKISVNTVSPGYTLTRAFPDSFTDQAVNSSLFKRIADPEDIAKLTTFLSSPESAWITGQNIQVNGGIVFA